MANEERELQDLLRIKRRRLSALKRQAATLGYTTPPELRNEIEDLERETNSSSQVIEPIVKGELPDDIMAALRAYGVPASVNNALQLVEAALYELRKESAGHRSELHSVKDQVIVVSADVQTLKADVEEGRYGRRRNFKLQIASITLSAFVLGAFLWLLLLR
jgi:hypothetical protein